MTDHASDGTRTPSVSSVSQQKEVAEVEAQRLYLEQLAMKRQELKALLEDVQSGTSLRANNESAVGLLLRMAHFFCLKKRKRCPFFDLNLKESKLN
eukprot:CAMPEP_0195287138 /NCGR_PEP_ID=MMETSP0707-20130614/4327_1 /TAXON_ID=33640 /ORGANISM="Asterionellopsis glacialis, Strain CCMP134" /LENGTH=95 /DNA_ID=CAMNT_0040346867 /DNA_START=33 /DNA_END=321 /DNA_ORIENTATION=+